MRRRRRHALESSSTERILERFHQEFIKSHLYRLYRGDIKSDDLVVTRMMGILDGLSFRMKPVTVTDDVDGHFVRVLESRVNATVKFKGFSYDIVLFIDTTPLDTTQYICYVHGVEPNAGEPKALLDRLLEDSIRCSPLLRKSIELGSEGQSESANAISMLRIIEQQGDSLDSIYLPNGIKRDIEYFVKCLKEYNKVKKPLRYLLAGNPGTAKTKLIRAIASECREEATFVMTTGSDRRINAIFDFANHFTPGVLCIDDIDLMAGSREERLNTSLLATFLQKLDGFVGNRLFLLATTNDKALIDYAASRPGRFDAIIDIGAIESTQYLDLIRSKTEHAEIVRLFDESVMKLLESKNVTGAFIANLVKHLELVRQFEPEQLTKDYVTDRISNSYVGFYKAPTNLSKAVGF